MHVKQINSMILDPNEKKQIEIWTQQNDLRSLVWYVQQLVHYAYRVGLEQNLDKQKPAEPENIET
jgi:hypothetical protein